ncbi:MAG: biosynthetic peptidoglycan transglycosylase [Eubacteriales bacterium]|nr:biosynthetic peptidoglycan transglycosylase [Eubacteriales bacterium]
MKKRRKKKHRIKKRIFTVLLVSFLVLVGVGTFWGIKGYEMYHEVISGEGIPERVEEIRNMENFTAYSELPQFYIQATVSVEDHRFKKHCGIDLLAIGRAMWRNIEAMDFVEGGSTITQQFAKNLLFTQEKSMERKAAEVFAALEIEALYTKEEIFELYVNTIYFGNGYYGIYQAAMGYYEKTPMELTKFESAMLAGLPNAPSVYSAEENRELAEQRVAQVLRSMVNNGVITQKEVEEVWEENY